MPTVPYTSGFLFRIAVFFSLRNQRLIKLTLCKFCYLKVFPFFPEICVSVMLCNACGWVNVWSMFMPLFTEIIFKNPSRFCQGCLKEPARRLQSSFRDTSMILQDCSNGNLRMIHACLKYALSIIQWWIKDALNMLQGY